MDSGNEITEDDALTVKQTFRVADSSRGDSFLTKHGSQKLSSIFLDPLGCFCECRLLLHWQVIIRRAYGLYTHHWSQFESLYESLPLSLRQAQMHAHTSKFIFLLSGHSLIKPPPAPTSSGLTVSQSFHPLICIFPLLIMNDLNLSCMHVDFSKDGACD